MELGVLKELQNFSDQIDIRSGKACVGKTLDFCVQYFALENAFWFYADAIQKRATSKEDPLGHASLNDSSFLSSFPSLSFKSIEKLEEKKICEYIQSQGLDKSRELEVFKRAEKKYLLFPVFSKDLSEFIGHILLEKKTLWGKKQRADVEEVISSFSRWLTYSLQIEAAKSLSYKDHLTPLYNQKYLSIALDREIYRAQRYDRPFSILFFDVDNFKRVNDSHGHLTGSQIISDLGRLLEKEIRESDYGFRFGGDEFVALLVETSAKDAEIIAERVRKRVESHVFKANNEDHRITISVGVATYPDHGSTREEILSLADKAMYYGKRATKNIVYVAS